MAALPESEYEARRAAPRLDGRRRDRRGVPPCLVRPRVLTGVELEDGDGRKLGRYTGDLLEGNLLEG